MKRDICNPVRKRKKIIPKGRGPSSRAEKRDISCQPQALREERKRKRFHSEKHKKFFLLLLLLLLDFFFSGSGGAKKGTKRPQNKLERVSEKERERERER